jgi:VCBS repeat-containing protein
MGPIVNTDNQPISQPLGVTTFQVGGKTFVYAAAHGSGAIQVYSLDAGVLTPVQTVGDNAALQLNGVMGLQVANVGGVNYLFAAGFGDSGISVFSVGADGALTSVFNQPFNGTAALSGATDVITMVVGGDTYLAVTGQVGDGLGLFRVNADGSLTSTAALADDGTVFLDRAYRMASVTEGGNTYLIVEGNDDFGLSVFRVDAGGVLTNVQNIGDSPAVALADPYDIETAVVGGTTYVFVTGSGDNGVSVFSVGAGGQLTNVSNFYDDASSLLNFGLGLAVFEQQGQTYLAVGSYGEPGLQFLRVAADGSLTAVDSFVDTAQSHLNGPFDVTSVVVGGRVYAIAIDEVSNGISVFDVGVAIIPDTAKDDAFAVAENAGFVANVRADNGSGADAPALAITAVNGQPAAVGMKILLPSGAYLTLQANGTFQYLTNGAFNSLAGAGSGAQNLTATDSFTYTVANGDTATVTVTINGVDGNGDILQGSVLADNLVAGIGHDTVNGLTGNDFIDGGDGNDTLLGGAGNDIILGGAGIDRLDGGKGADAMTGGAGNDTYVVDDAGDTVTEGLNGGTDTVESSIDYLLGANVENLLLTGVANISGIGNALSNHMTGNAGANSLSAGAGNDFVYGMGGDDTLAGGAGVDTMYGGSGADILDGGAGGDKLYGEVGDDTLIGGIDADVLDGGAGNDVINGGGGNDSLIGGTGNDTMRGGAGNDVYSVDNILDQVFELAGEGEDVVNASVSFTLSSNVEVLNLIGTGNINGTGSSSNNRIYGNAGANTLDGGLGDDILVGGAGSDTYVVDSAKDVVTELAGEGTDTVRASLNWVLGANVENLTLTGTAANGTGNAEANTITGTEGANLLLGLDGNDKLVGNGGEDRLVGGAGSDNLSGGTGNDILEGGSGNNVLSGGTGSDVFRIGMESVRLSASSAQALQTDQILDFSQSSGDRIDLTAIDADSTLAGDQAFTFVSVFGMHAGEATLIYDAGVNQTILRLDIDGDGKADYQLRLDGDAGPANLITASSTPAEGGWLL